jgi:hypothetical protein
MMAAKQSGAGLILGYHGCDAAVAERLLAAPHASRPHLNQPSLPHWSREETFPDQNGISSSRSCTGGRDAGALLRAPPPPL